MKPSEILHGAIEHIDKYGWCKNVMYDNQGRMCLVGALRAADGQYVYQPERHEFAVKWYQDVSRCNDSDSFAQVINRIDTLLPGPFAPGLPAFNDAEGTSQEDVILLLKEAAHSFEEEGK